MTRTKLCAGMSASAAAGSPSWRSVTFAGTWAGKASGRGSTQVTAKGSGASASTSARPTWPAPKRMSGRRSSPKASVSDAGVERGAARRHRLLGDDAPVDALGDDRAAGDEPALRLARGEVGDRGAPVGVDHLDDQVDLAAAALAEFGAERIAAHSALGADGAAERRLRHGDGAPFQRAAADGAGEGAVGMDDQPRAGLARRRAAGGGDRHHGGAAVASSPASTRGQTGLMRRLRGWWRGWRA